jgi:hypothetical protein
MRCKYALTQVCVESQKVRNHFIELHADGRSIVKWVLKIRCKSVGQRRVLVLIKIKNHRKPIFVLLNITEYEYVHLTVQTRSVTNSKAYGYLQIVHTHTRRKFTAWNVIMRRRADFLLLLCDYWDMHGHTDSCMACVWKVKMSFTSQDGKQRFALA